MFVEKLIDANNPPAPKISPKSFKKSLEDAPSKEQSVKILETLPWDEALSFPFTQDMWHSAQSDNSQIFRSAKYKLKNEKREIDNNENDKET